MTYQERRAQLSRPIHIAADLVSFTILMVGSLVGSLLLIGIYPVVGYLALVFSFCYMAWQFENFGRIREFRLITGKPRPLFRRDKPIFMIATIFRVLIASCAVWPVAPGFVIILVSVAVGLVLFLYTTFTPSALAVLIDEHERIMGPRRRRHLIEDGQQ